MHLNLESFDPQLIKGKIFQYCKGLTASIKNNPALVQQPFHSVLLGDEDLKHHTLQLEDFIYCKTYLQKNSLRHCWKGPYQVLLTNLCANKL